MLVASLRTSGVRVGAGLEVQTNQQCPAPRRRMQAKSARQRAAGVSVSKVGGNFVHKPASGRFDEKSTFAIRESVVKESPAADQEAQARELAAAIAEASQEELLEIARTLV